MARAFEARYFGECLACGGDIVPGDEVVFEDDDVIHTSCAIDPFECADE